MSCSCSILSNSRMQELLIVTHMLDSDVPEAFEGKRFSPGNITIQSVTFQRLRMYALSIALKFCNAPFLCRNDY